MKEILKNKWCKFWLFLLLLYIFNCINNMVSDYFVMKSPNAYLTCGVRDHEYFERYEKRSSNFRVGAYSIEHCRGGKLGKRRYLALTDYESGYIYRALPLNVSEDEMYSPHINEDTLTITMTFLRDPDGKATTFCFYRPIPWVHGENFKATKEEFIEKYNRRLETLDRRECF